ncbi:amino acid transporter [Paraburkholderia silvatlantica]|uniref:Amino acid transporter n=1 Tax=Paraburkholderia silvatlantica TaxID=321895 RepID=A0A2V4UL41_9BURK|nr:APC family permease [Paraburkholderia silvatlantica]PYE21496.1 amino acid transporter [Paraburkholderia silvatlantica]
MLEQTHVPQNPGLRQGALSIGFVIFFVVSAASPLSVLAGGFPIGIMLGNGAGTPALLLATLGILLIFSAGYTAMARHVTNAGGFYAFTCRGVGGLIGGGAGMLAMFCYNILQIGIYGLFGAVVSDTMSSTFHIALPWWVWSFIALASIAVLGYRQIDLSARLLSVMVTAEYISILILDACILFKGGQAGVNLDAFTPASVSSGSPSIGLLFCFAAFIGFEATTIYGEEAKDPKRAIPIATFVAVLLIGGFYSLSLWSMVVGAGASKIVPMLQAMQDPTTFIYGLSDHYAGHTLTAVIRVLFMVSIYAGLLAFHNSAARYFFASGRDRLLPQMLGRAHGSHQSPHIGSVLQSVIAASVVGIFALAGADPVLQLFAWLSNVATLCVILLMAITSVAVIGFFRRNGALGESRVRTIVLPAISCVLLIYVLVTAIKHFDVLTGASGWLADLLCSLIPLALILGIALAARLRRVSIEHYRRLGAHTV